MKEMAIALAVTGCAVGGGIACLGTSTAEPIAWAAGAAVLVSFFGFVA